MNIDDLRRELRARAADPGGTSMDDRLAGVRRKVVIARRRRQAAGGAAALAALVVVGGTWTYLAPGPDGADVADREFAELPAQLHGDFLIEARYNEPDASELAWETTLDDRDVVATVTCQLPEDAPRPKPDQPVQVAWQVGGSAEWFQCAEYGSADAHMTVMSLRSDWGDAGIRAEEPFTIELRLEQGGTPVEIPGARFGVGLYDKTGERVVKHGVELTEVLDVDGDRYRLADWKIQPLDRDRQVNLRTEETDGPIAVLYGWHVRVPAARYELRQDGETLRTGYGDTIEGPTLIDGESAHRLSLHAGGSSVDGYLVLAYYTLDD